jgi:hypothetical protein
LTPTQINFASDPVRYRIYVLSLLAFAVTPSCLPHSPNTARLLPGKVGVYHFVERVAASGNADALVLEGELTVLADTVTVDATPGPCRYDTTSTSAGPFVYRCAEVTLSFDRSDPVRRASYSLRTIALQPQTTCVRYATDASGRTNCAESKTVQVERSVMRSGQLRPEPVP